MERTVAFSRDHVAEEQKRFILRVYNWMTSGLCVTGFIAYYVSQSEYMLGLIMGNPLIFYGLIIAELGLVFYLASAVMRMSAQTAMMTFLGYAALNGLTFSFIFIVYTQSSIASAFLVTAGTFGGHECLRVHHEKRSYLLGRVLIHGTHRNNHSLVC